MPRNNLRIGDDSPNLDLMRYLTRFAAGTIMLVAAVGHAPGASAGVSDIVPVECPTTVIVAARGNDSMEQPIPARYGGQSNYTSNGYEGPAIAAFLHHAEQRYAAAHSGESLLEDTYVLGLTEEYYPANTVVPVVGNGKELWNLTPQVGGVITNVVNGLKNSLEVGIPGVRLAIESYEMASGCTPQYVLIGYSLGAVILPQQEAWLAEKDQLAGTLYFASVLQAPGDPAVIGARTGPGGLISWLPDNSLTTSRTPNRIMYCIPDDFACDPTPTAAKRAIEESAEGPHAQYFLNPEATEHVNEVADRFSSWIVEN